MHAKHFRNLGRTVIGQQHAAGADADTRCGCTDCAKQDFRTRIGEPVHVVVFRQPVAVIAEFVGGLGQLHGLSHSIGGAVTADDG